MAQSTLAGLACNNCAYLFTTLDKFNYHKECKEISIYCDACINTFISEESQQCSLCHEVHIWNENNILQLPSNSWEQTLPNHQIDTRFDMRSQTPVQIMEASRIGIEWWQKQQVMSVKKIRKETFELKAQIKKERKEYQSEVLRNKNIINELSLKVKQQTEVAIKYKKGYGTLKIFATKVETKRNEKERELNELNAKYTTALKQKSLRTNKPQQMPNSSHSFNPYISNKSNNPGNISKQKSRQRINLNTSYSNNHNMNNSISVHNVPMNENDEIKEMNGEIDNMGIGCDNLSINTAPITNAVQYTSQSSGRKNRESTAPLMHKSSDIGGWCW